MDDKQEKVLSENWRVLRKCLEPKKLLPHLETVLDYEDKETIKNQTNRTDQSDLLLDILHRRGPRAFDCFVKALQKEKTQDYLAHLLKKQIENKRLEIEQENLKIQTEQLKTKLQSFEENKRLQNKRLLELEIELENFKDQTEELKTKLLCFEENKRLQNKRLLELEIELENFKDQTEELKTKLLCFEENKRLQNKRLLELEIELENFKDQTEELKTKLLCFEENKRLRRLSGLQSSRDDFQEPFDDSSGRQSRRMECERTSRCQKSRTSTRLRNELSQTREYHFRYEGDFDTKGVIHYLGFNAGVSIWLNPARVPSSGVKVTYCDGNGRGDPENILEYLTPVNSSTRSGWCLDLGDYYTLRPTDYTVRQLGSNDRNFLQNFELLGRLCNDDDWCVLGRHHQVDWRSQRFSHMLSGNKDLSYKTKTWSVKGEVRAYSQFKIVQIKDMSTSVPGTHAMSLAGIELYGVLSVPFFE